MIRNPPPKRRIYAIYLTNTLVWMTLLLPNMNAYARVDTKSSQCFRRVLSSGKVIKRYDNCRVYIGTHGNYRALWGIEVFGDFKIQAHSDAGNKVVYANGKEAILFTSNGKSPDTLRKDQYFCIGFKGDSTDTCAYGFLMPLSR